MEELQPLCEKAISAPLAIQYSSTFGLRKRIDAGEAFDGTIITTEAVAALTNKGTLASGSRELGRSPLGIGIQNGARKADIRTVTAFKQALHERLSLIHAGMAELKAAGFPVDGDRATARCYSRQLMFRKDDKVDKVAGLYHDTLVKRDGRWQIVAAQDVVPPQP